MGRAMSNTRRRSGARRRRTSVVITGALVCAGLGSASRVSAQPSPRASQTEITVAVDEPRYDGFQAFLDAEARIALSEGKYQRALGLFSRLVHIDPHDVRALRESGRIAHALGEFSLAASVLGRVDQLDGTAPDPELRFIRAECLYAMGKKGEAMKEYDRVERELGPGPHDRRGTLWLARVAIVRGDLGRAIDLYEGLLRNDYPGSPTYSEALILEIEAYATAKRWSDAEVAVRELLRHQPDHARGKELLAWVLESQGKLEEEIAVRAEIADGNQEGARESYEYARALERANEYSAALGRYRQASAMGLREASDGIIRIQRRLAPEVGGGYTVRDDPSGTVSGWQAGVTVPLGPRVRLAATMVDETASAAVGMDARPLSTASGWGVVTGKRGSVLALGTTVTFDQDETRGVGGSAVLQSSPQRDAQLQVRGDVGLPWRESASTVRDGGAFDALGATVYLKSQVSSRRVLASFGTQLRRLTLEPKIGLPDNPALQLFGSAGVDVTLTSAPRVVRGESYDGEMLGQRSLSHATVLSYRHYELAGDNPFGQRLVLVERSSIDELSGVVRRVIDRRGVLGAELRAGLAYDWVRYVQQWRAGASLLVAAHQRGRLALDYDVASESGTGLVGRRHLASVVLHVDL